jgi:hypothetical protein
LMWMIIEVHILAIYIVHQGNVWEPVPQDG